jgi:hypothetical protein
MFREYKNILTSKQFNLAAEKIRHDFPHIVTDWDKEITFDKEFIPNLRIGRLEWTIKFQPGTVRLPITPILLVIEEKWNNPDYRVWAGYITVQGVCVGNVRDWPENHPSIKDSGFDSKAAMIKNLSERYEHRYDHPINPCTLIHAWHHTGFVPIARSVSV